MCLIQVVHHRCPVFLRKYLAWAFLFSSLAESACGVNGLSRSEDMDFQAHYYAFCSGESVKLIVMVTVFCLLHLSGSLIKSDLGAPPLFPWVFPPKGKLRDINGKTEVFIATVSSCVTICVSLLVLLLSSCYPQ